MKTRVRNNPKLIDRIKNHKLNTVGESKSWNEMVLWEQIYTFFIAIFLGLILFSTLIIFPIAAFGFTAIIVFIAIFGLISIAITLVKLKFIESKNLPFGVIIIMAMIFASLPLAQKYGTQGFITGLILSFVILVFFIFLDKKNSVRTYKNSGSYSQKIDHQNLLHHNSYTSNKNDLIEFKKFLWNEYYYFKSIKKPLINVSIIIGVLIMFGFSIKFGIKSIILDTSITSLLIIFGLLFFISIFTERRKYKIILNDSRSSYYIGSKMRKKYVYHTKNKLEGGKEYLLMRDMSK